MGMLANLFVKLGLRDSEFKRGIDGAQKRTNRFGAAIKKVGGMIAGAFAVGAIVRFGKAALGIITDFEQANATLAATMGKGVNQIKELTKQANALGKSTMFTASQVSSLQNELAKLGFSGQEIQNSAKGILDLAAATGTNLAESAKIAGSALRAFGYESEQMDRVTSVLAVSTTKSALSMSDFATSLSTVAPVAKAFGFSIEDTVALLGKLKDAGFDASSSATATRNILLNLADSSGALAKSLGGPVKSFDELIPALVRLRESGVDLNEMLQVTDKRSVAAFSQFLSGAESSKVLRDSLIDVNKELAEMVNTKTDTVVGEIDRLKSAWEGLVMVIGGSTGWLKTFLKEWTQLISVWQAETLSGWQKFWASISGGAAQKYYNEILKKEEKKTKEQEYFNNLTLEQLNSLYDAAAKAYIESVKTGNKEAEADYSAQMSKIKTRIDELISKNEELGESTNPDVIPYNTLEDAIDSITQKIEELQNSIAQGEIIDPDKLKEATSSLREYKDTLADLVSIYKNINRESAPDEISTISGTPQIGGDTGMADGLADMTGFVESNNEKVRGLLQEQTADWDNFVQSMANLSLEFGTEVVSQFGNAMGELMKTGEFPENFGQNILRIIGRFISQLGKMLIALGSGALGFQKLLASAFTNPASAIAAIAAGAALVAIGGAISGFASSGPMGTGGSAGGYSVTSQAYTPLTSLGATETKTTVQVQGVLQGDNILLSNQRAGYRRGVVG